MCISIEDGLEPSGVTKYFPLGSHARTGGEHKRFLAVELPDTYCGRFLVAHRKERPAGFTVQKEVTEQSVASRAEVYKIAPAGRVRMPQREVCMHMLDLLQDRFGKFRHIAQGDGFSFFADFLETTSRIFLFGRLHAGEGYRFGLNAAFPAMRGRFEQEDRRSEA